MISRDVTMAFSAEMAGTDGKNMLDVKNLQESNGSVGVSPSATAYFATYIKRGDAFAAEYSVKDSDDTSLAYDTLLRFGCEKDLASVLRYEEKDYFRCFE